MKGVFENVRWGESVMVEGEMVNKVKVYVWREYEKRIVMEEKMK